MKGHGGKLPRKQEEAISALLTQPTIEAAAAAVGIGRVTMWRWLQLPHFKAKYVEARRGVLEAALSNLQKDAAKAVEALVRNLTCGLPAVEVRSAQGILDESVKAMELFDLEMRLDAVERRVEEMDQYAQRPRY